MLPDLDPDLGTLGAGAVYAIVLGFVFVESGLLLGFFLPGDTILFGAGLVSAEDGSGVHLGWLVAGAFVAAVLGDSVGYADGLPAGPHLAGPPGRGRPDGPAAPAAGRAVLPALRLVVGGDRPVDPLGAHLHARCSPGRAG